MSKRLSDAAYRRQRETKGMNNDEKLGYMLTHNDPYLKYPRPLKSAQYFVGKKFEDSVHIEFLNYKFIVKDISDNKWVPDNILHNWYSPFDLLATKGEYIYLVDVKYRSNYNNIFFECDWLRYVNSFYTDNIGVKIMVICYFIDRVLYKSYITFNDIIANSRELSWEDIEKETGYTLWRKKYFVIDYKVLNPLSSLLCIPPI